MKNITRALLFLMLSFGIWSCNANSQEEVSIPTVPEVVEQKLNTVESFWAVFQKAVADRDIETIESLFYPDARTYKFGDKEYQEKIAKGTASDIIQDGEMYKGKKVFYFMMTFPSEEEGGEESATTIFFNKNEDGEFRIFSVIEAG